MQHLLLVGVGANLTSEIYGTPIETCRWAVRQIVAIARPERAVMSPWYRSAPIPASDQPDYINGVLKLVGRIDPVWLLDAMHRLEAAAGRVRGAAGDALNAARVLDLDLLAAGDLVRPGPGLLLPHPRIAERAFVLWPLCDIEPGWRHPIRGETALQLRDKLPPQQIERLTGPTEDLLLPAGDPR